ncbi:hypothetical protein CCUS01_16282 [Colletotrichum cuscutae]|uniref:Uncharacterized protein n=1 Tax=Colletotrichum cuscutae TaxID=1209917 RepID=A0AAI9VBZ0_9PEZI|nr:hypothetical protein CCUS01_16282 [Colletotrichum cuscutae]
MQRQMGFVGRGVRLDFFFVFAGTPDRWLDGRKGRDPLDLGPGFAGGKMGRWEGGRRSFLARPANRIRCPVSFPRCTGRRVYPSGRNTEGSNQCFVPSILFRHLAEKAPDCASRRGKESRLAGQEQEKCTFPQCLLPATSQKVKGTSLPSWGWAKTMSPLQMYQ